MAWTKSISLDIANKIFASKNIQFEFNQVEGSYEANYQDKKMRRKTLILCCIAVVEEWMQIAE